MSATNDILAGIDPQQLAAALGTDEATAMNAAAAAIPTLIASLQANAASTEGSEGLLSALGQHADSGLFGDTVDLNAVDTADGQKIVAHALANDPQRLQAVSGLGGNLLSKLLPLLAPIVMSYLARRLGMGGSTTSQAGSVSILGDILGGAGGSAAGGGLGDILSQILAYDQGSQQQPAQGSGDILGGLLGQILGR
jgi:hypothetical protein